METEENRQNAIAKGTHTHTHIIIRCGFFFAYYDDCYYYSVDGMVRVSLRMCVFMTQLSVTLAMRFVRIKYKSSIFKHMHRHTRNSDNLTGTCRGNIKKKSKITHNI